MAEALLVCGWDEVFELELTAGAPRRRWTWRAAEHPELPAHLAGRFGTTDDCKPVDGHEVLITSSGGAVALVDRSTGAVRFAAAAGNAHSAALLPHGLIAVAASHLPDGSGDRLLLFHRDRWDERLAEDTLPWGHGVVWDAERDCLWALAHTELRAYRVHGAAALRPSLECLLTAPLPGPGGHDLSLVPNSPLLHVTATEHAWVFDRDKLSFTPHPLLGQTRQVKSMDVHPTTARLAWVQADPPDWWSMWIRLDNPEGVLAFEGQRLYKARWLPDGW